MGKFHNRLTNIFSAAWLLFILIVIVKKLIKLFPPPDQEISGDAFWTYIPNARAFEQSPWEFITTNSASLHVAPLSYMWPAFWNADPAKTQLANCILFLLAVVFLWRFARHIGGTIAGMVTTALIAFHPEMLSFIPQVMTEPLYFFGFSLFLWGAGEYATSSDRRNFWLTVSGSGLAITLASRPALQIITVGLLIAACTVTALMHRNCSGVGQQKNAIFNKNLCVALILTLLVPAVIVLKNGIYFQYWGISTGAGSGLYYGTSPFKMGIEPIYTGFSYDADITPRTADPSTAGQPLIPRSDAIMTQTATSVIKNTTLIDNINFFAFKAKSWLIFTPQELTIQPKLRLIRVFEWLCVIFALIKLSMHFAIRWRLHASVPPQGAMPVEINKTDMQRGGFCLFMLVLLFGMVAQFLPVLYNMRYNLYFIDPILMPLCGISLAYLLQQSTLRNSPSSHNTSRLRQASHPVEWIITKIFIIAIIVYLANFLTQHARRHEFWAMDPLRPGPTEIMLDAENFGKPYPTNLTQSGPKIWRVTNQSSALDIPVNISNPNSIREMRDAIWRIKLAVNQSTADRHCRNVRLAFSEGSKSDMWYMPKPVINVRTDGGMHLYAWHGNGELRPAAGGRLTLSFNCPPGTTVQWGGAQLLKVTMPEAARDLIHTGKPINPYRPDDVRLNFE